MANNSKMMQGIQVVMEMINEGKYVADLENGVLFNRHGKEVGKVGADSGNRFYTIGGYDILAHRLFYALYHGYEALDATKQIKHIDGDKLNNTRYNLVQIERKGAKKVMEMILSGELIPAELQGVAVSHEDEVEEELTQEMIDLFDELDTIEELTDKERMARRIVTSLNQGRSIKEVAEQEGVSKYFVYDVKRGKSHGKVTADLRN